MVALARWIVGRIERREPREEPDADLERERQRRCIAGERGGAAAQLGKLLARRVRVDADRARDRALQPAQVVVAVVTGRQVVEARDLAEPDLVERLREQVQRAPEVLVLVLEPQRAARGVVRVPLAWRLVEA